MAHFEQRLRLSRLEAPITGEIEKQLQQLIDRYGLDGVEAALAPLVTKCKWQDWFCVTILLTTPCVRFSSGVQRLRVYYFSSLRFSGSQMKS